MKSPSQIIFEPKINEVHFPLFKFQKAEHAENMLNYGEVHIPNLYSFKGNNFGGLIDDTTEGEVRIKNHYHKFNDLAENAESLLLLLLGPGRKNLENVTLENVITNLDALIYCTTSYLFADSLSWAKSDKKESCVMIADSELFFHLLNKKLRSNYPDFKYGSCLYLKSDIGVFEENNAGKESLTNKILHDRFVEFLLKPKKYSSQREVRGIFRNSNSKLTNSHLSSETIRIPEIKDILVEIKISEVDIDILSGQKEGKIKMYNVLKTGEKYSVTFESPNSLLTPLVYKNKDLHVGFSTPNEKTFVGGTIIGDPPLYHSSLGSPIFASAKLKELSHIEIVTENN